METNEQLKSLYMEAIRTNHAALKSALSSGLIDSESLDVNEGTHRQVLLNDNDGDIKVPDRFLKSASAGELTRCLKGVNLNRAQAEVDARFKGATKEFLREVIDKNLFLAGRSRQGLAMWPAHIQTVLLPILADPTAVSDLGWESSRRHVSTENDEAVTTARANAKRKATIEATKKGERQAVKHTDPLLAAIAAEDSSRLRKLDLERIKPDRWEKAKELWLTSTDAKVKAHLTRLPLELIRPHMKEALEAEAEAGLNSWELRQKSWAVPKAVLKELSPSALVYHLTSFIQETGKVDAPITQADLTDELIPVLVAAAVMDDKAAKVAGWLDGLRKARKVVQFRSEAVRMTPEETAMFEAAISGLYGRGSGERTKQYAENGGMVKVIRWFLDLDEAAQKRMARVVLKEGTGVYEAMCDLFGLEGPNRFGLEGPNRRTPNQNFGKDI